jgi:hypothetical protein
MSRLTSNPQLPKLGIGNWQLGVGSRIYVIALVDQPGRAVTIAGRRIEIVRAGGLFAAIESGVGPLPRHPDLSEAALREQHAIVVALARRFVAILPARFGAWVDPPTLEQTLTTNRTRIRRALARVKNRDQFTIRILGDRQDTPPDLSSGTAYLRSRRAASRPRLTRAARDVRRAVKPLVRAEQIDSGRGSIRLTIHHLIDRGRARAYRAAVRQSVIRASDEQVVVSGPWPPFAFAPDLLP